MKKNIILMLAIYVLCLAAGCSKAEKEVPSNPSAPPTTATITKASGGSVKTELGYGIVVNKESSLMREWITVHDNKIPAEITGTVGVKTIYDSGGRYSSGSYEYKADFTITAKEDLSAIEVRFLTFDF